MTDSKNDRIKFYLKKYRLIILLYVVAALAFIFGDIDLDSYRLSQNRTTPGIINTAEVKTAYPLKITDFLDREVTIEKRPDRIVSLSSAATEILYSIGAGSRLTAEEPALDTMLRDKPDLVFASDLTEKEQIETLEKAGIKVVMLHAAGVQQIFDSILKTGQITDAQTQSRDVVLAMQNKIGEIQGRLKDRPAVKVFYLTGLAGNQTAGKGTLTHDLITMGGGENIAADLAGRGGYPLEKIVEKDPAVILAAPAVGDIKVLASTPGYKDTAAAKTSRIYVLSGENILSRPSNTIIVGLEEIARFLHPEAFK